MSSQPEGTASVGRSRSFALSLVALGSGLGLVIAAAVVAALGAPSVSAQNSCDSSGTPITIHYQTVRGTFPGVSSPVAVSGVVLSQFPAACDGQTVKLEMYGNSAGDPTVALSADTLLSTADSTLDACSQSPLPTPGTVTGGSITLSLCAKGGKGGYVSVHDLTALALAVPATSGGVLGASTGDAAAVVPTPDTGSGLTLPDGLLGLGLALLLAGLILLRSASWRRDPLS